MYITKDELISLFGEEDILTLTDRKGLGVIDEAVLGYAIEAASSEVDSYLSVKMPVPLHFVPLVVKSMTGDIVRYRMVSGDISETDPILVRYEKALVWLKAVSLGQVSLPGLEASESLGICFSQMAREWDFG